MLSVDSTVFCPFKTTVMNYSHAIFCEKYSTNADKLKFAKEDKNLFINLKETEK